MTFGLETTDLTTTAVRTRGTENIRPFFEKFKSEGYTEIDTARFYGNGETEQVCCPSVQLSFTRRVWSLSIGAAMTII